MKPTHDQLNRIARVAAHNKNAFQSLSDLGRWPVGAEVDAAIVSEVLAKVKHDLQTLTIVERMITELTL